MPKKNVLSYDEFHELNEGKLDKKPFDPKFAYKAATTAAYIKDQIESIAMDLAMEKHLSDPKNYPEPIVTDIDRSRALKFIFHSDWKDNIIQGKGDEFVMNVRSKAEKKDEQVRKNNTKTHLNLSNDDQLGDREEKIEYYDRTATD
jgi:hypothetical protein